MYTNIILTIITAIIFLFLLEIIKIRKLLQGSDNSAKISPLDTRSDDELYEEAKKVVIDAQNASIAFLQRKLKVGYAKAANLMDMLEENNVVKSFNETESKETLVDNKK